MYKLGDRAQAFLPGNRKLPDYMKGERDIYRYEHMTDICHFLTIVEKPGYITCPVFFI